jgi:hypothetical protein
MRKLQVGDKVKNGLGREGVVVLTDLLGSYPIACRMVDKCRTIETIVTYTEEGRYHVCSPSYESDLILEPEPSWSSIPIDAKVLVWNNESVPSRGHFAGVNKNGKPTTWFEGQTSFTTHMCETWDDCELYKGEE